MKSHLHKSLDYGGVCGSKDHEGGRSTQTNLSFNFVISNGGKTAYLKTLTQLLEASLYLQLYLCIIYM